LKFNPAIDDIQRQPIEKLDAIKEALDVSSEFIDFSVGYKYVKDQVVVVLKSRHSWLKKKIKKGESKPQNCTKAHWDELIEVLKQ
jgi:hypothetical protein